MTMNFTTEPLNDNPFCAPYTEEHSCCWRGQDVLHNKLSHLTDPLVRAMKNWNWVGLPASGLHFPHHGRIACCSAPNSRPPATKALQTIHGNNTSIVSNSCWWAYKCPKHVEIISAIKHSVTSSWFSSLRLQRPIVYWFVFTTGVKFCLCETGIVLLHIIQTDVSLHCVVRLTISLIRTATSTGWPVPIRKLWTSKGKSSTFCWHTLF